MRAEPARCCRSVTATRPGSPYRGPFRSLFPSVRHGAFVAFLLRHMSHEASSGNDLTASTGNDLGVSGLLGPLTLRKPKAGRVFRWTRQRAGWVVGCSGHRTYVLIETMTVDTLPREAPPTES